MSPEVILEIAGLMSRITDNAVTDLPEPDSPTIPIVLPFGSDNEMLCRIGFHDLPSLKSNEKLSIVSMFTFAMLERFVVFVGVFASLRVQRFNHKSLLCV